MAPDNKSIGLTVAAVAGWQVLSAWNSNAPSLREVRSATPDNDDVRAHLLDADILVGGTAIILGTSVAILTGDKTALLVMLAVFGSASLWHHAVLHSMPTVSAMIGESDDGY